MSPGKSPARFVVGLVLLVVGGILGLLGLLLLVGGEVAAGVVFLVLGVAPGGLGLAVMRRKKDTPSDYAERTAPSKNVQAEEASRASVVGGAATLRPLRLLGGGYPDVEVMGENFRRNSFRRLYAKLALTSGDEHWAEAQLIPEPTNAYDPNAVMVVVEGEHVGYLAREDAAHYAPTIVRIVADGRLPVTTARVWASNDDGTWRARVTLSLGPVTTLQAVNGEPAGALTFLPTGRTVQVTGEERHQDHLELVLGSWNEAMAYATLHAVDEVRPRSVVPMVEVRVDGTRVGSLSTTTGTPMLPTVRGIEQAGRVAVTYAAVKRGANKVDVSVDLARTADCLAPGLVEVRPSATDRP